MPKMPDITKAQILAALGWALAQAVSFNWISSGESQHIYQICSTVVAIGWIAADMFIRRGRARAHAAIISHQAVVQAEMAAKGKVPEVGQNIEDAPPQPIPVSAPLS